MAPPETPSPCGQAAGAFEQAFEESLGREAAAGFVAMFHAQLEERFQSADRAALRADAHKVAGSAGLLGFDELGAAALALESACEADADIGRAFARVREEAASARTRLAAWRDRLQAAA